MFLKGFVLMINVVILSEKQLKNKTYCFPFSQFPLVNISLAIFIIHIYFMYIIHNSFAKTLSASGMLFNQEIYSVIYFICFSFNCLMIKYFQHFKHLKQFSLEFERNCQKK